MVKFICRYYLQCYCCLTVVLRDLFLVFLLSILWFSINKSWLGGRVVSVMDSGSEEHGFESQSRRCRVTVLGKLFTPIVPLLTKQQNW